MIKNNKKRGQAALEFLTTYGWAFMVILVMIGALAYFGILNPDRFLPERCSIGPNFACEEYVLHADDFGATDGELRVVFANQVGQDMTQANISSISWAGLSSSYDTDANCAWYANKSAADAGTSPIDWSTEVVRAGESVHLSCEDMPTEGFSSIGSKLAMDLDLQYRPQGGSYNRPLSAEIFATVQAGTVS